MADPFLGEIKMFPFNWPPVNWASCNGALLGVNQNAALFSLLGTMYGGDGRITFGLPDLQGRVPIHRSNAFVQGTKGGEEQVTLILGTMPAHNHNLLGTTTAGNKRLPEGALAASNVPADFYYSPSTSSPVPLNPGSIGMVGGGLPHPNVQPFVVVGYCIATMGIYPSRG